MSAPPAAVDLAAMSDELRAAARRATDWLLARVNADGSLGDPTNGFTYYRAAWTFTLMGEVEAAAGILGWIRRNLLTAQGDLSAPARRIDTAWSYSDAAVVIGAQMLHQHDLSVGLIPEILQRQDPVSGGFANDRRPDGSFSDDMDIPYACGPGFACLMVGELDAARRVGEFLARIHAAQQELPDRFYCFWSRSRQRPIVPSDPEFETRFVVENQADRMQRWTIGGIAAAFLCRLYLADDDPTWLELARTYQDFSMAATEAQFKYPSVCKSSWGAALLYQITGEQRYLDWLGRFGRWYVDSQDPDGPWHPWVEEHEGHVIDITLEYVMHIQNLLVAVASRRALGG